MNISTKKIATFTLTTGLLIGGAAAMAPAASASSAAPTSVVQEQADFAVSASKIGNNRYQIDWSAVPGAVSYEVGVIRYQGYSDGTVFQIPGTFTTVSGSTTSATVNFEYLVGIEYPDFTVKATLANGQSVTVKVAVPR